MAILYGTTADGESLPVEVNEFGQLVAQGLQGQAGTPGQPGPPGPPGVGELPPDPYEGAVLGWKDNQLSWIGVSVPLPEGTYGPILSYLDGTLTLETPVDLPYLASVFLSDALGNRYSYTPVTSQISAVRTTYVGDLSFLATAYGTNGPGTIADSNDFAGISMAPWFNPALDDVAKTGPDNSGNAGILLNAADSERSSVKLTWSVAEIGDKFKIVWGGLSGSGTVIVDGDISEAGTRYTSRTDKPALPKSPITLTATKTSGSFRVTTDSGYAFIYYVTPPASLLSLSDNTNLDRFRVGDFVQQDNSFSDPTADAVKILAIDSSAPSLTTDFSGWNVGGTVVGPVKSGDGTVQTTLGNAIVLRENNDQWIVGQYVTAPEQALAARLVYKDQLKEVMQ